MEHCCFAGCVPKSCGCCVNEPFGHDPKCPESPVARLTALRESRASATNDASTRDGDASGSKDASGGSR